jgi:C-terminal processing protease CtpA/Prc
MKVSPFTTAVVIFMLLHLSMAPALAESPLIKGRVQHNAGGQATDSSSTNESKPAQAAPVEGKADSNAQLGATVESQQPLDGQISKELREKTFLLQNGQSSAQLGVQQQSQLQAKANGGEEVYGCLGALLNSLNGAILKVFPQSDLNNLDVQRGDRIVGVSGHPYNSRTIIQEMIGTPGTIIELDIQTPSGIVKHLQVRRTDARLLPQTGIYKQLTKRNRFW